MRFSQRKGLSPIRNSLQQDSMDDPLRNGLWSAFDQVFVRAIDGERQGEDNAADLFFTRFWFNFRKHPTDAVPQLYFHAIDAIRRWFHDAEWYEIMDFVEYLASEPKGADSSGRIHLGSPATFVLICNRVFESEASVYRIADQQIVEITDKQELVAIEEAMALEGPWATAGEHLAKAARLLFDRKNPDYPNAVKEAISAVESACCVLTGTRSTLGQAIKVVEKEQALHPALKEAFTKLYGYTSDAGGIRHGSIDMTSVSYEEAKYLLVACSAFVNYLKGISAKGI